MPFYFIFICLTENTVSIVVG